MKHLILIALALVLSACGQGPQGPRGVDGAPAPSPAPSIEFAGFYELPDGGYLEIVQDSGALNDLTQVRIIMRNEDNSASLIPLSTASNIAKINDSLYYFGALTYSATHNVKNDVGNAVLTGSLQTLVILSKVDGVLNIRVQISNGPLVVFDHTIEAL